MINASITKFALALLLLVSGAFISINSYNQQRVTTSTRAVAGPWNQCNSANDPTNTPCGSCSITGINADGTVNYSCQLVCHSRDNNCPQGSWTITEEHKNWSYCDRADTSSCPAEGNPMREEGKLIGDGPWTIQSPQTPTNGFTQNSINGTARIARGTTPINLQQTFSCGMVQADIMLVDAGFSHAGALWSTSTNCLPPPTNTPIPPSPTDTPLPTDIPPTIAQPCPYIDINAQVRKNTGQETPWLDGDNFSPSAPFHLDVNCFATNRVTGQLTTLNPADISINQQLVSDDGDGQLRNHAILNTGTYTVSCTHPTLPNCENTDTFTAVVAPTATDTPIPPSPTDTPIPPTATNTPTETPTRTPSPTRTPTPIPTETPIPTATTAPQFTPTDRPAGGPPVPSNTPVVLTPTIVGNTPTPTNTMYYNAPTTTSSPTKAITPKLEVNNQPPGGITSFFVIAIPVGLLLLGLLL